MLTKNLSATIAIVGALAIVADGTAQTESVGATGPAALDAIIEQHIDAGGLIGVGAAIIVNKHLVWSKGYGFADRGRGMPFTPRTVMAVGSISKTVTGVALMRAVQDGKLSLDENINRYLPFRVTNPSFPEDRITLRQLATHTSSITDRWSVYREAYHFGGDAPQPLGDFLSSYFRTDGANYATDNFLEAKPGTHRDYSNIGAALAGYIVERAVGEALPRYTRRHIFDPLGMEDTGWFLSEMPAEGRAKLYASEGGLGAPFEPYGLTTYPDGGVRTSVADLSKLFIALLNDGVYDGTRILEQETVDEMLRFHYAESSKPDNVDLREKNSGIFWATKMDCTRIGHGGSDPGLKTDMLADLSKEIGVVLFTNTSVGDDEGAAYVGIFRALWAHAEAIRDERAREMSTPVNASGALPQAEKQSFDIVAAAAARLE